MSLYEGVGSESGGSWTRLKVDVITYISRLDDSTYLCLYNWPQTLSMNVFDELNIFVSQFQCAVPSGASFMVLCHVWHAFVSTSRSLNLY